MKTNQLMKRDFEGMVVEQRTDNAYLSATDILRIYNQNSVTQKKVAEFTSNKNTIDFMEALLNEENLNVGNSLQLKNDLIISKRGKQGSTYMHPYLFIKFAMWLSPEFEVKVIKWVYDNLIVVRNEAGNHYVEMCDTIKDRYMQWSKGGKPEPLIFIKEANFLKTLAFGYKEKDRNEATEKELRLLDTLQLANIRLIKEGVGKDERHRRLRDFAVLF